MTVKTPGDECLRKTWKRAVILLAFVTFWVVFLSVPASASGVPSKIITFTDKKVYWGWWVDSPGQASGPMNFVGYDADFGDVYVYAIVLDDDGKIMKGRSVTGNLYDVVEYDHDEKADATYHNNILADPNLYDRTLLFNDTGANGDGVAGDGIYTAKTTLDKNALGLSSGNTREENHIKLRVYANDTSGGLSEYTEVLISYVQCMNGLGATRHGGTHITDGDSVDNCAVCHVGYEHFFENISGTIAESQLDIHASKWNAPDVQTTETCGKGFEAWVWNRSWLDASAGSGCVETWEQQVPGSKYCFRCHTSGTALYDYDHTQTNTGATTRVNPNDKPSCNNAACHSTTDIEATTVIPWTQAGAPSGAGQNNYNVWKEKRHNHSTTPTANASCALCHLSQHSFTRPNPSTTNLTLICETCHNRTDGWLNVSKNQSHPKTSACKNCHVENNKLDVHTIPTGSYGGRWCLDCHKINGKSPLFIDENTANITNPNYIHYRLNNGSDASNSSRICWACHTNNTLAADNVVNQTEVPLSSHPESFSAPRKCLDCHNNTGAGNFNAPQEQRHTWWASMIKTPAVTYCTDCHAKSDSMLAYNQSASTPRTDNASVSHYGKNRTDMKALALVGSKAYCTTCHQNESTVYGPFAKESNKVRSDHASNITTPSCMNSTCHRTGRLHDDSLVKPNFTEGNITQTCLNCHSNSSYKFHNSTLTCWDCHMNDTAGNIHPIQFIQYNGNYTGAKLTGATCYDCHKTTNLDNTTQRLAGTKPPKIYSQSHSNDPINGTKWGDYWKYTPTVYQFASYEILGGNGSIDPAHPFGNIETPSNDYMELNETQTGRAFEATFPSAQEDREFTTSQGSWTGAIVQDPAPITISGSYDSGIGNPAGSLKVTDTDSTANNEYAWTSPGFYYNGTGAIFKYANFSMDRRRTQNDGTTRTNVTLVRPVSGNVVIYSSGAQTGTDVSFTAITVADISSYLTDNGTYNLRINTTYVASGGAGPSTTYYDNVKIVIKEKVWNRYEIIVNTTNVPVNGSSMLGMAYQVHKENTSLQIYNKTSGLYELLDTLDKGVFYDYTKNISSTHHINPVGDGTTGNVSVKFVDDDQSDADAVSDNLHIRYLYVYTDRGLQYPCEQCHSPNKHYVNPTLGSPSKFNASNKVNQSISSSGTWCQQCHWQGAANYSLMIQEFNVTRNPPENVPPEITGNATYAPLGGARDGTPYKNHSGFDLSDLGCFNCHKGSLSQSAGMTAFIHGVSEGTSGGANCTNCHNIGGSAGTGKLVNFTAMNDTNAIHKNLNKDRTTSLPAENKKCWACHGNGSEPLANDHPTKYNNPYRCPDCHVPDSGQNFNYTPSNTLLNVTQHYWNGTNITTANATSCYACHNRSEMMVGLALDPDGVDEGIYSGANGGNNSTSHYGKKRSDMAGWNSTAYCTYCHNTTTNNATFYVSDFNNTIYNHSSRASTAMCTDCHYSGRLHNSTLAKPTGNDSYCSTCHGTSGTAATNNKTRHKALNCTECHANNSVGTLAGKDIHAVKYLTQSNTFAASNSSAVNCVTCHQTSNVDASLSGFTAFKIMNPMRHSNNASNGSVWDGYWTNTSPQTACIYCHNDTKHNATPLGRILQWNQNYKMYGSIGSNFSCSDCHYKGDANYTSMDSMFAAAGLKIPPEITNGTNWKGDSSNYYNHSLDAYDDAACKNCHGSLLSASANMSEFLHNVAIGVAGGANCTNCHNIGGTAGTGKLVNISAMNDTNSIHKNLNSNAQVSDANYSVNKKCWACHGNGSEPSGHPSNYKTPYNCTSCHIQGAGQNFNYTPNNTILNVSQHYWSGASISTANATSCYACHNKSEMMIGTTLDPDGAAGVNSGANGGNLSVSHYGKKRGDMASMENNTYCKYCHDNQSSAFPFINNSNKTIANHSINYPSTNPACANCHEAGRIHNSTLYRPAFALPNSTYCLACHGSGGSATIKNFERHNSTSSSALNCTQCHLNSTKSIHPVRYLQQDGLTWDTSKTNAVNCTTCHQSPGLNGFNTAPLTPKPLNHSTNSYSGALWNNTQPAYWTNTSQQSSCEYCHGKIALHNNSGLGNITRVKGNNQVRQTLENGTWCANCHYSGASNYAGTSFSSEPPEITNYTGKMPPKARDNTNFYNHSQDMATGYNDSKCKNCHDNKLDAGATSLNFSHNVAPGGGGANCTSCHYIGGSVQNINITAINDANSIHKDLNKDATASDNGYNNSKKCWACHGSGQEPSGHPSRYKTPYNCTDCHVVAIGQNFNYTPNNTILNITQHYWNGSSIRTPNATSCYACHNTTGMITQAYDPDGASSNVYSGANGGNDSVSHYGKKRGDMASQQNTTPYCDNCHNGSSAFPFIDATNRTIANHSLNYPATNPACKECHNSGRIHNSTLYKTSLGSANSTYCLSCHGNNGAGGTNYSGAVTGIKERHNNTGTACTQCHLNASSSIHPVRYLQQDNSWDTSKVNAVNCTTCHQGTGMSGFGSAPRVPSLNHSTNTYSGALWNGSQPGFWDNTSQQSSCNYCHSKAALHNLSGLGNISKVKGSNAVKQSFSGGYWCANCHYAGATNYSGDKLDPKPPEVLNTSGFVPATARDGTQFYNHSGDLASSWDDAKCKTCHDNKLAADATSLNFTHSLGSGGGGANCTNCHGLGGNLADGKRINQTAMNSSLSLHRDLNRDAQVSDANYSENKKCWACHGDGTEPSGHPTGYKTPYNCVDCHVQGAGQNFNYIPNNTILNVTQHYWNGTSINTSAATSCYACHNKSEMMLGSVDPDGQGTSVYGGANGGNNSTSHYGKKRSDMAVLDNTTYCSYCHNNQSSVFPFINTSNKTIANHSMNYPATNPACRECHEAGRIHNSTLYKPAFTLSNSTYCLNCHGNNGTGGTNYTAAVTAYKEKHNNSLCTDCHLNSTESIHPVRYLKQNSTWGTTNGTAVNCTSCHQGAGMSGFASAPLVQMPIWHSNNSYSGALWNGTQPRYWDNTSQQASCDYCHGKQALHNLSGLGKSALVQANNSKNQSLSGGYWCTNCHYKGKSPGDVPSGKYNYKGDLFSPVPPEIFNLSGLVPANASDGTTFQNHTKNGVQSDWSDDRCQDCHGKDLQAGTTSATFLHRLNKSKPDAGGPDCLKCHPSTANEPDGPPTDRRINKTAFINYSVHRNLNKNATNATALSDNRSKACWACHGNGLEPPAFHPAEYITPKQCEYCHVNNNFNATLVYRHYPGAIFAGSRAYNNSDPNRNCIACHNNSVVTNLNLTYGTYDAVKKKNATAAHYAVNRTLGESLELSGIVTAALPNTRNTTGTNYGCNQCHEVVGGSYGGYGSDYGSARSIPYNHNRMGSSGFPCQKSCHNSNPDVNITLHDANMGINIGTSGCYSSGCHTLPSTGGRKRR